MPDKVIEHSSSEGLDLWGIGGYFAQSLGILDVKPPVLLDGVDHRDGFLGVGDGQVNILDLILVAGGFGTSMGDVNRDGVTNILDLTLVAQQFE